jgi:chloride channel 3/4/5
LKFLDPYGTNKTVLFDVQYKTDWKSFEMIIFILIGIVGGAIGALFIKACRAWAKTFRCIPFIKRNALIETTAIALLTGLSSFWNNYTRLGDSELLSTLATPCDDGEVSSLKSGACASLEGIPALLGSLAIAFIIKSLLTIVTFGLKVPAGIYIPSMAIGGLLGKFIGHAVQILISSFPDAWMFSECPSVDGLGCVTPGVYAMIGAGVTMCGITRLPVTLAIILFELTGSLSYMACFSVAIFVAKWVADVIEPSSIYVRR